MLLAIVLAGALAAASPLISTQDICENPTVISQGTAGKDGEVLFEYLSCSGLVEDRSLSRRQSPLNVCGAPCVTNCFPGGVGTGPNPNDCHVIADALLYDSQNVGALFNTNPANGTGILTLQYQSCKTFFLNQANQPLQYCRTDFSSLVNYVAFNCQAQQNAHGGNCVANDQRWFVQVQHV